MNEQYADPWPRVPSVQVSSALATKLEVGEGEAEGRDLVLGRAQELGGLAEGDGDADVVDLSEARGGDGRPEGDLAAERGDADDVGIPVSVEDHGMDGAADDVLVARFPERRLQVGARELEDGHEERPGPGDGLGRAHGPDGVDGALGRARAEAIRIGVPRQQGPSRRHEPRRRRTIDAKVVGE